MEEKVSESDFSCLELLFEVLNEEKNVNVSALIVEESLHVAKDILCLS